MNIRPASFRDLARIEQLYRESVADAYDVGQISSDSPVPQATLLRLWYALTKSLSSLVPATDSGDALLVAEDAKEGVVGFIQAQSPPGRPKAWQILNLCTSASALGHFARDQLIQELCNHGLEVGVHRFHVRVPVDHPLVSVFLEHGFIQLATEQILYCDEPPVQTRAETPVQLQPARRDDIPAIHLLYLRTTPSQVATFEGPSVKAWQAGYAQGLMARMGRDDVRHFVVERPGVVAWAAIRPPSATQPAILTLMCEGHDAALREAVIDAVLHELPPGPTLSVLRHYDSELIRALQQRGFEIYGAQRVLVCDLGNKVRIKEVASRKKPVLVHAGLAQSVPVEGSQARLRVVSGSKLRSSESPAQ
jgi:L-amino acid N-acyltransferase YncA